MNQEIRNKLRNVVTQCRKLLEDSVSQELEGKYAIFAKKDKVTANPNAAMVHLTEEEQAARRDILDHFGHIQARGFKPKDALDQLVREIAFTHLNRLCAYKMMEAREVYVGGQKFREAVSRGIKSNGFLFYLGMDGHEADERLYSTGQQDLAYRHFLDWLGGLLSDEIGVLFNPNDPANRLYPRQKTLDEVLDLLNDGSIKAEETELKEEWQKIWSQDETIGWVYQYFTPKELRDQARKESLVPRNSYELAFRNQFFTPRYVVEFLTDNTLGRIWYEMRKGNTTLKDQCRYLVRRPVEIFLEEGQQRTNDVGEDRDDLSREELFRCPVEISHRPKKDPRELKILDPACGSGHFLLYCFDLLQTIYEEAYSDSSLSSALKKDYGTIEDLRRALPRLILAHNLHGIDIDLRASQIAALALWLRCQRAYQEIGLKKDRPKITRSNFVCAEPMPGEEQMLKDFVGQLEPKVLGQVVEVVFDKMKLVGETGSLLKIEEEIRDTVATAKSQWVRDSIKATDRKGQPLLFTQTTMDQLTGKPVQPSLFDLTDITDNQFFEEAEARTVDALRQYAEIAQSGQRLLRTLFSEDAVRGFAFVDLCRTQFDVILMNPPFGSATKNTQDWFRNEYPSAAENLTVGVMVQSLKRLAQGGILGLIGDLPWLQQSTYVKFRSSVLDNRSLELFVELGWGILGTDVEVCLAVFNTQPQHRTFFASLVGVSDQSTALATIFQRPERFVSRSLSDFLVIENHPFAYQISDLSLNVFKEGKRLANTLFVAAGGVKASDADRVFRCWWEVPSTSIGRTRMWAFCQNGSPYCPYYYPTYFVILSDGGTFTSVMEYPTARIPNSERYWTPGLAYGKRTWEMYCYPMPSEQIITQEGNGLFPLSMNQVWQGLAIGNSSLYSLLANLVAGQHKYAGYLNTICMAADQIPDLGNRAKRVHTMIRKLDELNELSHAFDPYLLVNAMNEGESWSARVSVDEAKIQSEIDEIDNEVLVATGETNIIPRHPPSGGSYFTAITDLPPSSRTICESIVSLLIGGVFGRWELRYATEAVRIHTTDDPFVALHRESPAMLPVANVGSPDSVVTSNSWVSRDGIVADDSNHKDDIVRKVLDACESIWSDKAETVEKLLCVKLEVASLRDYFRKSGIGGFLANHLARYSKSRRKAPIYWLLQSTKKNYALWLYYHRFDKDLLFKALVNYVEPKIRLETSHLETLRSQKGAVGDSGKEAKRLAGELELQEDFLSELRDFEDRLRRAANLHLVPDLNDGVVLNIAPLWELVPWKEAKSYWEDLLEGKYEWSSIGKQLRQKGLVK